MQLEGKLAGLLMVIESLSKSTCTTMTRLYVSQFSFFASVVHLSFGTAQPNEPLAENIDSIYFLTIFLVLLCCRSFISFWTQKNNHKNSSCVYVLYIAYKNLYVLFICFLLSAIRNVVSPHITSIGTIIVMHVINNNLSIQ